MLLLLLLLLSRFSHVRLCATPWTAAYQAPPSLGFPRQEHWRGVPSPSPSLCPAIINIVIHVFFQNHGLGFKEKQENENLAPLEAIAFLLSERIWHINDFFFSFLSPSTSTAQIVLPSKAMPTSCAISISQLTKMSQPLETTANNFEVMRGSISLACKEI